MRRIIYISGKITGLTEQEATARFNAAEELLKAQGYEVINPMNIAHDSNSQWRDYMKKDIAALMEADNIYMLKNWRESDGANLEYRIAGALGYKIIFEN
jgi:hypothetical protein